MASVKFNVHFDDRAIQEKLETLIHDDKLMYAVHALFAKTIDPWVPYLNGPLSETVEIEPNCVRYIQPYARYQYYGVGFNHTIETHPLASALWDKVAMQTEYDPFKAQVRDLIVRRAKELNG